MWCLELIQNCLGVVLELFPSILLIFFISLLDINECKDHNGHCLHFCHDTKTGFHCSCRPGYQLADDKKSCQGKSLETKEENISESIRCLKARLSLSV